METYLYGGVLSITSRIMLIDLLKERIPAHLITGIMILDAHRIAEFSLEAFIIDLFRSKNKVSSPPGYPLLCLGGSDKGIQ